MCRACTASLLRKQTGLTRAREGLQLAEAAWAGHIPEPMAGSPLKRVRKLGIRAEDGSIIAFPRMPPVSELPPGWRHWSPAEKIEHLLGMSLDRCYEILSWGSYVGLDPLHRSFQMQVMRVLLSIGIKAYLDGSLDREAARDRNRAVVLEKLARDLSADDKA